MRLKLSMAACRLPCPPQDFVRDFAVEGDSGELFYVARALARLQAQCGMIPFIKGKGAAARALADLMLRLRYPRPQTRNLPLRRTSAPPPGWKPAASCDRCPSRRDQFRKTG